MNLTYNEVPLGADGCLSQLDIALGKELVQNFKDVIMPNQPNFVISKADWQVLCEPKKSIFPIRQIFPVYAFVFCYAINPAVEVEGEQPDRSFYFRIRRILENPDGTLSVDTDNIYAVDLATAHANQHKKRKLKQSCLRTINSIDNAGDFEIVNTAVAAFDDSLIKYSKLGRLAPFIAGSHLPITGYSTEICAPIIQEGNIFGKHRIWDELLNGKYSDAKRAAQKPPLKPIEYITVNFAFDIRNNGILFVFNINDDYGTTGIKCPGPPVCGNS